MVSPYFGIEAVVLPLWYFHSSFSRKLLSLYWTCPLALKKAKSFCDKMSHIVFMPFVRSKLLDFPRIFFCVVIT